MVRKLITVLLALVAAAAAFAEPVFDRTAHDFGKVSLSDGPLECSFTVTNSGTEPLFIQTVVSSCGCTSVSWTRTPIAPGQSGEIRATYKNDEGPFPFDKILTVYTSESKRPSVLHIRGVVTPSRKTRR